MAVAPPTAPPAERRAAARRQPAQNTVCRFTARTGDTPSLGLVWNISASGLSMLLHHRLEPGITVRAELSDSGERVSLPLTVRVAHVRQLRTGDYILGAQFARPLTPEEMRPFLA